jgi:hypothetical protein
MVQEKFCEGCSQSERCREIYRKLGRVEGRSFTVRVIVAFLLPLLIFIGSLAAFEKIFAAVIDTAGLRTVVSFLAAFLVTFGFMLVIRVIGRQLGNTKER